MPIDTRPLLERFPPPWIFYAEGEESCIVDASDADVLRVPWDGKPCGYGGVNDRLRFIVGYCNMVAAYRGLVPK